MKRIFKVLLAGLAVFVITAKSSWAQAPNAAQVSSVPHLVQFSGTLKDASARAVTGVVSVTFAIYGDQDGGTDDAGLAVGSQVEVVGGGHADRLQATEAKPEVWSNWADFSKRMNEFAKNAALLAAQVKEKGSDDPELAEKVVDALSCKSCHDVYRKEKK